MKPNSEFRDALLSPKLVVKKTPRGYGHFAAVPIFIDEILVRWDGRASSDLPPSQKSLLQIDEDQFLQPFDAEQLETFNHSCTPNAGFQGPRTLVAMRPIALGEEIVFDKAMALGLSETTFSCDCASPHCRKLVSGNDWTRPELQARYRGYFSPYLQRRIDTKRV